MVQFYQSRIVEHYKVQNYDHLYYSFLFLVHTECCYLLIGAPVNQNLRTSPNCEFRDFLNQLTGVFQAYRDRKIFIRLIIYQTCD